MLQDVGQSMSKKQVVAEDERAARAADEVAADDEGIGETAWLLLGRVVESKPPLAAVAEKVAELS